MVFTVANQHQVPRFDNSIMGGATIFHEYVKLFTMNVCTTTDKFTQPKSFTHFHFLRFSK